MIQAGPVATENSISAIATFVDQFGLIHTKQTFFEQLKIPALKEGSFSLSLATELTRLTSQPTPQNLKQAIAITEQLTRLAKDLEDKRDSKTWEHVLKLDAATNGQIVAVGECGWTGADELSGMVRLKNVGSVPFKGTELITQVNGHKISEFSPIEITAGHLVGTVTAEGPHGYGTFPYHNGKVIFEVDGHPIRSTDDVHLGPDGKIDAVVSIPETEKPPPLTFWQRIRGEQQHVERAESWQNALVIAESKLILNFGGKRIRGEIQNLSRRTDGTILGSTDDYPHGIIFIGDEIISKIGGKKFYKIDALTQLPDASLMGVMRKVGKYKSGGKLFIGDTVHEYLGKVPLSIGPHKVSIDGYEMKGEASLNYEHFQFELNAALGEIVFDSWRGRYKFDLKKNEWVQQGKDGVALA